MHACCPPGHGCNDPRGLEPCALEVCREAAAEERDAALALARWAQWRRSRLEEHGGRARRFSRRAYERARDSALVGLALHERSSRR
jgi:hypothetical protein